MLSYKARKYVNKEMLIFGIIALIGITVFILGTFFNILREEMPGIALGCIPTGIIGMLLTNSMKRTPEKTEKIVRIKTEERLQLIRYKTGYSAFWIMFIYIAVCNVFSRYIVISLSMFLVITVIVMVVVLLISSIVQHRIS